MGGPYLYLVRCSAEEHHNRLALFLLVRLASIGRAEEPVSESSVPEEPLSQPNQVFINAQS
jgi:hypothetical protein